MLQTHQPDRGVFRCIAPEDINWQSFSGFSCMEALRSGSISIAESTYSAGEAAFGKEGALLEPSV
jgi:hypothetical protein